MSRILKDFFIYEVDFSALAFGASSTGNINIQADSDFELQKLCYFADIAAASQTDDLRVIPLVTINITDSGSGRFLSSDAVPVASIFGTGQIPFILPTPKIFSARSTVSIEVANFSAATTYNLRLSFIGAKIFNYS